MLLNISSYITSAGLQAVTSSGPVGPYFAIKYFVPFYDYRLDTTISRGENANTTALSISSLNYVSATSQNLFGEKIFSNTSYTLSNNNFLYWKSTMGGLSPDGNYTNVPSPQSVTTPVNLDANGLQLSVVVSGTNFTSPSGPGFFNISGTHLYTAGQVSTYNPISGTNWPLSAFYRVDSYSPNANGLTCATGTFKCRIPPSNSSFKFNGLALYAVKVNSNGIDDYGNGVAFAFNPVLFSVVLLNQAQFKQSQTGGINDFEISVDLGFDWNTVSPGVSGNPIYINNNYWVKLPTSTTTSASGLNYTGDIVISSSAVGGSWFPAAKLTVTEPSKQQLRLGYDMTKFTDFRTIRFPISIGGVFPNSTDMAVLSIDTSCPQDSLLQLGYQTSALGIKSVAIGCYASATGYSTTNGNTTSAEVDIGGEGGYTVSIGVKSLAQGFGSVALGYNTSSIGYLNFAGGDSSLASLNLLYGGGADPGLNVTPINGLNFAYGKSVTAISRANPTNFDYIQLAGNMLEDADGSNVAFGFQTYAGGGVSFAHGILTSALGFGSFSLGQQTLANGAFSIAGGINSVAMSDVGFALGSNVSAFGPYNFVYGVNAQASSLGSKSTPLAIAIGQNVSATTSYSIALGTNSLASQYNSIAIGQNFNPLSNPYLAMTVSNGVNSVAIGQGTSAILGTGCFALGYKVLSDGNNSFGFGNTTYAHGDNSLSVGVNTVSFGTNSFAFNENTSAIGIDSIAGGFSSYAGGDYSVALGYINNAGGKYSVALGNTSFAAYDNSIAIGNGVSTTQANQIVIGSCNNSILIQGNNIQIGGGCNGSVVIPGISQFNDSIKLGIKWSDLGNATYVNDPRTFIFSLTRFGILKTITFVETGYNTNIFTITNISSSIINQMDVLIQVGNSYIPLVGAGIGAIIDFNISTLSTSNIVINLDKARNSIIIQVKSTTISTAPITNLTFFPVSIYYAKTAGGNNTTDDRHFVNWLPGINLIDAYINYDKVNASVCLFVNTNAQNGDGVCGYNSFVRTITGQNSRELSQITLEGITEYDNDGFGGEFIRTIRTYANQAAGVGAGTYASGMFINSCGQSLHVPGNHGTTL
jgi:hypothetical protein